MNKRLIGRAVFLRHGETNYTNVFPDLTKEGEKTIRNSAAAVKALRNRHPGPLSVVSSPAVRALGSASIIVNTLSFTAEIIKAPLLGPVKIKDAIRGLALYSEYVLKGGMRGLCSAYGSDPRFEDGKFIEPRSQVRSRFYTYLAALVRNLLICGSNPFVVHVSHYETLYHLVETPFLLDYKNEPPLGFGEIISSSLYDVGIENEAEICLEFRGRSANAAFNHKTESLVAGP